MGCYTYLLSFASPASLATSETPETLNALSDDKSARRVIEGVKAAYM